MNFIFNIPTNIFIGCDSLFELCKIIRDFKKIGIVYDKNLKEHDLLKLIFENITINYTACEVPISEPDYDFLDEFRKNFNDPEIEAVVGIGGGSTLDTTKAIAVLIHNKKPAIYYRGFDKIEAPVVPIFAIPTTAGTGSEITPNASFIDKKEKRKLGINGEEVRPKHAFLHHGFIMTCPIKPAVYAALDALVHALEAFSAKSCTLPGKMFSVNAISLILENIQNALIIKDIESIKKLQWGATMAAAAMMHSGTGPIAALSYPLGVQCKVPHGLAGAVFIKKFLEFNIRNGYLEYSEIPILKGKSKKSRCEYLLKMVDKIYNEFNLPQSHFDVGFTADMFELFLKDLKFLSNAIEQNPIKIDEEILKKILLEK